MYVEKSPIGNSVFDADLVADRMFAAASAPADHRTRDEYLHWDKVRHLDPPEGLTSKEWWWKIKFDRQGSFRGLPLVDPYSSQPFVYGLPDVVLKGLRLVDRHCSGEVAMGDAITSERGAQRRFLVNSLMEEAIRSSQLEGATTSRVVAKEMLRTGREPADLSERMIRNNFRALQFMRDETGGRITPKLILELHRIVTEGTLKDPSAAGRLQRPGEQRVAVFGRDDEDTPVHRPPPAEQLTNRLKLLCQFANEDDDAERFVHPVIRAILLHFWLAYDHPFEDGNGRTARILFFWSMRRSGYWLVEYLPISRLIRNARAKYDRAFLETERDGGDTTYFLIHELGLIARAIDDLHVYLRRKADERRELRQMLDAAEGLNGRQLTLLTHAIKHPDHAYTFAGHARSHRVTHETARADLGGLVKRGLMIRRRDGRVHSFHTPPDLPTRLKESPA